MKTMDTKRYFPLSALVFQPELTLALSLLATDPRIGGLLISGDRGAAKSTAARALASLLGEAPFINLPLGATEDRLVGTLDIDAAFSGKAILKRGLMAEANGGILYIDEVNLLADPLVDVLLDAAAMGIVRVERDGLSAENPARFALIGSMNPEEGNLRPQFLDRFGLSVTVEAPTDPEKRAEIIRRRMHYEADPEGFFEGWRNEEQCFAKKLQAAREQLPHILFSDELLPLVTQQTIGAGVRSLRADLVMYRAAVAHAALYSRPEVTPEDIDIVAPLVLAHRREHSSAPPPSTTSSSDSDSEQNNDSGKGKSEEQIFAPSSGCILPLHTGSSGKTSRTQVSLSTRTITQTTPQNHEQGGRLNLAGSLRAMGGRGASSLQSQDLRWQIPQSQATTKKSVLFVVDLSGSLGVAGRIGAVKAAMLHVLEQDKMDEFKVALVAFRATGATLLLDWTTDRALINEIIKNAPTGGRTPLAHGLKLAAELAPDGYSELVIFTDGKANIPLHTGGDPWAEALREGARLVRLYNKRRVIDTETGHVRLGRASLLANVIEASLESIRNL